MNSLPLAEIKYKDFPKFTDSDLINKEISNLFTLICNDFIARWFFLISEDHDEEFIEELVKIIDSLIKDLEIRLKKIDYIQLILIDVPVVIKQHIKDFYNCKEKYNTLYSEGKSFEDIFHGIQPHFALKNPQKEIEYFRKLMEILIRNSLPEPEKKIEPTVLIVREIMAKIVLENAIDALAEPNFIYECIAKIFENDSENEPTSTDNVITNEIITNYDKENEYSIYNKPHPNTFKRNTLNSYSSINSPITFNNYNNKIDESNTINTNEESYDEYESASDAEFSESIYRMIKIDKMETENKSKNRLSKTPGAFPDFSITDKGKSEESFKDEQDYYYDTNFKYNEDELLSEEDAYFKSTSTNYSGTKISNKNNNLKTINNNNNKSTYIETSENVIQTEPPHSFYYSLSSKLDINKSRLVIAQSIENLYNNITNKAKISYEKINNMLEFVRKPFNLFTVSSEKYNDYQLYKPLFDVINLVFQFPLNGTWISKKIYSLLDFLSYFKTGQLINRSLIRGVGWILSEKKVAWYMNELSKALWPNGHFIESKPPPTAEETEISRNIAQLMMKDSIPNSLKHLFGKNVIDDGFNRILEVFQNKTVNKHLLFILLDMIFINIYPEHYNQLTNLEPKYIQKPLNMNIQDEEKKEKVIANSQLEHELLSASNEPLIIPNNLKKSNSYQKFGFRERKILNKASTSVETKNVNVNRRALGNSQTEPFLHTSIHNGKKRLRRVSNYIKYMLNLKPLNQTN